MPTYDYECQRCKHTFEAFQSMTEKPLSKCPECGGRVRRLIGAGAGIIFKGSGFYATDYRSKSYAKGAKADAPAAEPGSKPACPAGKSGGCPGGACGRSSKTD
ncbi:MAG: zinc ribbon domain-containing protein [Verrucomicrobia bacterium]|nr:zinc ribbon domain-containing protein [Verrucomicrobiota bacterium]